MANKKIKKIDFSFNLAECSVLWGLCIQERLKRTVDNDTIEIISKLEKRLSKCMDKKALEMMTNLFSKSVEEEILMGKRGENGN